jgi:antitoxin (DNA-binding transcriptional repressor) of toxin-antitoxin stability system
MAAIINIPETTAQFAELIQRAQAGEEILLAQNGIAIARLVPIQAALSLLYHSSERLSILEAVLDPLY